MKWIKILNVITKYCDKNKNILIFTTNIYDYYYFRYSIYIKDDENIPYLWPNMAQHFVQSFGINIDHNSKNNDDDDDDTDFYIFMDTKKKNFDQNCVNKFLDRNKLKNSLLLLLIKLKINKNEYSDVLYDRNKIHSVLNGIIVIPYAVHTAKWPEFYSIGIPLFFPSLSFWYRLNIECNIISHRQFLNYASYPSLNDVFPQEYQNNLDIITHCNGDPYTSQYQYIWLPFSDYYNNKLFKYVIFYDNQTDLKYKITNHYNDKNKMKEIKLKQIKEWNDESENFKYMVSSLIYKAHYNSQNDKNNDCIPNVINLTNHIIENKSNKYVTIYSLWFIFIITTMFLVD